mmetsp:Transcript_87432/g.107186  ORF Transcript_87432/g.107186 Transcript_87432/m.107186 type:complete len:417 (+) Transcript_87432:43-1293(+)
MRILVFLWLCSIICVIGYRSPNILSTQDKQDMLDEHNKYRSIASSGNSPVSSKPDAKEMQKLVWDDGLARLATYRASQCYAGHLEDYSSAYGRPHEMWEDFNFREFSDFDVGLEFPFIGENVALSTENEIKSFVVLNGSIFAWADEGKWFDWDINANQGACNAPSTKTCAHWAQLTWSQTRYIGCGFHECNSFRNLNNEFFNDGAIVVICHYFPAYETTSLPWENGLGFGGCWGCQTQERVFCENDLCTGGLASQYYASNRVNRTIDQCDDGLGRLIIPCKEGEPTLNPNTPPSLKPSWAPTNGNNPTSSPLPQTIPPTKGTQSPSHSPTDINGNANTPEPIINDNSSPKKGKGKTVTIVVVLIILIIIIGIFIGWYYYYNKNSNSNESSTAESINKSNVDMESNKMEGNPTQTND